MEEGIFPDPAVAGILKEHYIEARLHTDDQSAPERSAAQEKLQVEMTGSVAQPTYVIIDPGSQPGEEKQLETRAGSASVDTFVRFFRRHVAN